MSFWIWTIHELISIARGTYNVLKFWTRRISGSVRHRTVAWKYAYKNLASQRKSYTFGCYACMYRKFNVCSNEIEVVRTKIVMQSAYTSAIKRSLLKLNGRDCDGSMHHAIEFYCCHMTTFWNLIGSANFQAAEVAVWTRGSCQAISPTAWERG